MSTSICWEAGLTCAACTRLIQLGEEMLYKRHLACAAQDAAERRTAAGEGTDVLTTARGKLAAGGRIILTARQLRALIVLACATPAFSPVRRPDTGRRRDWYGSVSGWAPERVAAGLAAAEVAGMWLDFLELGKVPPVRAADLGAVLAVLAAPCNADVTVTAL